MPAHANWLQQGGHHAAGAAQPNGPAAYEESFQAAQLRGRRMAAGAAAGAAVQKDATSNHHSAGTK